jgi:transposase InsO family protein
LGALEVRTGTGAIHAGVQAGGCWVYLAIVIGPFGHQVSGFAMNECMKRPRAIDALRMAWFRRRPPAGLIFHSGRGVQYASCDFQKQLSAFGTRGSMSRKGDCWDNAVTEMLFGWLKVERPHGMPFETRCQAKDEVVDWLRFYNSRRLHSTLNYLSPMVFEKKWLGEKRKLVA